MNTSSILRAHLVMLSVILAANQADAFYNPTQGRWLNRDPIEEAGSENLMSFASNDPTDLTDSLGLFPAAVFVTYGGHGSVEKEGDTLSYIALDDQINLGRVPLDLGEERSAAQIHLSLDDSFAGGIVASTDRSKLSPAKDLQMSTDLHGTIRACCVCPFTRVQADWSISARVTAKGVNVIANSQFDGNTVFATTKRGAQSRDGALVKPLSGACASFRFTMGQGWLEGATSTRSVLSQVLVKASFTCLP